MRTITAKATNFASYKELVIDFTDKGLTLVSGATGSGKSTLCDIIPWILFGVTSKGGAVDEIRSWNADEPTTGIAVVEVFDGSTITITRVRGTSKDNDLYYEWDEGLELIRGKDLKDTQTLLNSVLGLDADLYLAGAYFHEFSPIASFFTATAKSRRQLMEQLADLRNPIAISTAAKAKAKEVAAQRIKVDVSQNKFYGKLDFLIHDLMKLQKSAAAWEKNQATRIAELQERELTFDDGKRAEIERLIEKHVRERMEQEHQIAEAEEFIRTDDDLAVRYAKAEQQLATLTHDICATCGTVKEAKTRYTTEANLRNIERERRLVEEERIRLVSLKLKLDKTMKRHEVELEDERNEINTYSEQIAEAVLAVNPYAAADTEEAIVKTKAELEAVQIELDSLAVEIADLELLQDVTAELQRVLVTSTVSELERSTNDMLEKCFDAEIRVTFDVSRADSIDLSIQKDGNACAYTQLSKGQRQMLKLCFGVSVMKQVAMHNSVEFSEVFLDEALDGMDETLKTKAYDLLVHLETLYDSVFVVEHSPGLKSMFTRTWEVNLIDGASQLEEI